MQKLLFFLTIAILCVTGVFATPVSIEDAIESAKANNVSLDIAKLELEKSLRSASTLQSWLPEFSLTGSATTRGSAINQSFTSLSTNISLGVSYSLGTNLIGNAESARIQETLANITYLTKVQSLEDSVRTAYLNLQSSKISIESSSVTLNNLQATYESTKDMYESGLTSELNLLDAELALKKAEYSLKALNDAYELSLDAFKILTGINLDDIELDDLEDVVALNLPSAEALIAKYSNSILSLQSLDASIEQAERNEKDTKLQSYYPSLSFSAGWDLTGSANVSSTGNGSSNISDSFHTTVSVSIPISSYIPNSNDSNNVKNAEDSVKIAKLNKESSLTSLTTTVKNSINTINQQYENIALAEESLELSKKTLELKKESYEAGLVSVSDIISAENNKLSSELSLSSAKAQYIKSLYELASALGTSKSELVKEYSI